MGYRHGYVTWEGGEGAGTGGKAGEAVWEPHQAGRAMPRSRPASARQGVRPWGPASHNRPARGGWWGRVISVLPTQQLRTGISSSFFFILVWLSILNTPQLSNFIFHIGPLFSLYHSSKLEDG